MDSAALRDLLISWANISSGSDNFPGLDRMRLACERAGCPYVRISTDQPWADVLSAFLATRQHRYG